MKRLAVLGAGISGLALCYRLQKQYGEEAEIVLFDHAKRVGGCVQTVEKEGFFFECGPRSLRSSGLETWELIKELGLEKDLIFGDPSCHNRFILEKGALKRIVPWKSPIFWKAVFSDLLAKKGNGEDETIYSFASRRFGEKAALTYFDPLIRGIFAGDIRKLSMMSCLPELFKYEQKTPSVVLGYCFSKKAKKVLGQPFYSFKKGIQTLVDALFSRLKVTCRLGEPIGSLEGFSHIFSTLPAYALYPLLKDKACLELPFASVVAVGLGFEREVLSKKGFGYLVPSSEKSPVLGVVFDSAVFPRKEESSHKTCLTVMLGGTLFPKICGLRDEELLNIAKEAIFSHLGINLPPKAFHIARSENAIPQYPVNHALWAEGLKKRWPWTFLGSSFCGVSVNDCIRGQSTAHASQGGSDGEPGLSRSL